MQGTGMEGMSVPSFPILWHKLIGLYTHGLSLVHHHIEALGSLRAPRNKL